VKYVYQQLMSKREDSQLHASVLCSRTSTSSSSMTCRTTPNDSMKPLTATRSMRFVVARYAVRRMVCDSSLAPAPLTTTSSSELARLNSRRTSGDSSASTCRARRAEDARRCVGSGMSIVLSRCQDYPPFGAGPMPTGRREILYRLQT
jgi:hypothetical protein